MGQQEHQTEAAPTGKCHRLHDESPVLGLDAGRSGPLMRRSSRWERNINSGSHGIEPHMGKEVAIGRAIGPSGRGQAEASFFILSKLCDICRLGRGPPESAIVAWNRETASTAYYRCSSKLWFSCLDPESGPKPLDFGRCLRH